MYGDLKNHLSTQLKDIQDAGLFKRERIITTAQDAVIETTDGEEVLNLLVLHGVILIREPNT